MIYLLQMVSFDMEMLRLPHSPGILQFSAELTIKIKPRINKHKTGLSISFLTVFYVNNCEEIHIVCNIF